MSDLVLQQQIFAGMVGRLLCHITTTQWRVTLGEAWRTPEQAEWNAKKGTGIKNSLHRDRLAIDLNFFLGNKLVDPPSEIGLWWESIGGTWGSSFGDPAHFSLAYGGRK